MIAPIAGKFRKQVIKDITISLTLGAAGGAAWWNLYHIPNVQRQLIMTQKFNNLRERRQ
ncbi:hypothetical protein INT46_001252 [Mucor plumbeus]|uniref:Cytochrome c oxidase polypeptide VIIA n=1 Tax=Mucor plumbeus TaxID=97098 RepID=A0A8H7UVM3_9FUNG|nr:hypothetical protein INT46_001252 [Mucor plumbeus]